MTREEALAILRKENGVVYSEYEEAVDVIEKALADRPHGEWVHTTVGNTEFINCKNCGCGCPLYSYVKKGEKEEKVQHYETDFCPNCGADMREGEAE